MIEIRWIWKHWKTWEHVPVVDEDDSPVMDVLYLGCLILAWHHYE